MASLFNFPFFKHRGYCYEFYFFYQNYEMKYLQVIDEDCFKEKFDYGFMGIDERIIVKEIKNVEIIRYAWDILFEKKEFDLSISILKFVKRVKVSWYDDGDEST